MYYIYSIYICLSTSVPPSIFITCTPPIPWSTQEAARCAISISEVGGLEGRGGSGEDGGGGGACQVNQNNPESHINYPERWHCCSTFTAAIRHPRTELRRRPRRESGVSRGTEEEKFSLITFHRIWVWPSSRIPTRITEICSNIFLNFGSSINALRLYWLHKFTHIYARLNKV